MKVLYTETHREDYMEHYKLLNSPDSKIIDVASDFYCRYQNKEYNNEYKAWRTKKNNKYGFNYVSDRDEKVFMDGAGYIEETPEKYEKRALNKLALLLGIACLAALLIDTAGNITIAKIIKFTTIDFDYDIFTKAISGCDLSVCLFSIASKTLIYAVPIIILLFNLKLPEKVAFPVTKMKAKTLYTIIKLTLIFFVITYYLTLIYFDFLEVLRIKNSYVEYYIPNNYILAAIMMLFYTVVIPFLNEFLFRGLILQSLRQFGDSFALLFTSFLCTLFCHDLSYFAYKFVLSYFLGFLVLMTGSIYSSIIANIILETINIYLNSMNFTLLSSYNIIIINIIIALVLAVTMFSCIHSLKENEDILNFKLNKTYMTLNNKFFVSTSSYWILLYIAYSFFLTIIPMEFY